MIALRTDHFDQLARGEGDTEVIALLTEAERSRRLLLLHHLFYLLEHDPSSLGVLPPAEKLREEFIYLQQHFPGVVDELLLQPQTGVWLSHAIRRLRTITPGHAPMWWELARLHTMLLLAHCRAGCDYETTVALWDGRVMLPSLGLIQFEAESSWGTAGAICKQGVITLTYAQQEITVLLNDPSDFSRPGQGRWLPLRHIETTSQGLTLRIALDDIDPFRNFADPIAPERIPDESFADWRSLFEEAWQLLCEHDYETASVLSCVMSSVTPLVSSEEWIWTTRSGSTGDAFGAAIIAPPAEPIGLAEALVHEFQHNKMSSLLHLVTLCHDDGREYLYAPWRDDPRPLEGMLHGIYAFVGITRFWRQLQSIDLNGNHRLAQYQFSLWRRQLKTALVSLEGNKSLSDLGAYFTQQLLSTVESWCEEEASADIEEVTTFVARDHYARWRISHLRPDPLIVHTLVNAYRNQDSIHLAEPVEAEIVPDRQPWSHSRTQLLRTQAAFPQEFVDVLTVPRQVQRRYTGATASDLALITDNPEIAANSYIAEILSDPRARDAWVGLGLALSRSGEAETAKALLETPELVQAVHLDALQQGEILSPREVARWVSQRLRDHDGHNPTSEQ